MKLTIDNQEFEVKEGMTVLDAAEKHGIYTPHLCSHPELTSYGGCRLCIVEVDGMRGYPTACTTQVKDGMVVRTESDAIQGMRQEILQLILSEHPSGCLVCDESEECGNTQETIRKVGTTTGCRWCPKDVECELQKVVKYLGVEEIKFPVYYQDLDVEKYDPFFDRDYNLCIYCARCVRICSEHRKSFVLALNERGKESFVGTAFHKTHVQADCEFCGACISVCPTGALSEKSRKWAGAPDEYKETVCPLCSLNCDIQVLIKNGKLMGSLPLGEPHESGGELCVKGRFCLTEMLNHPDRLIEPVYRFPEGEGIISMEDAFKKAGEHLQAVKGKRAAMYLSPNLTVEEIAAAAQFAQKVMKTDNITSSILSENMLHYLEFARDSVSVRDVEESGIIVAFFLKGNYDYAPVTLAMKRAGEKGTPLCRVGWSTDTASRFSDWEMAPQPGKEVDFFKKILGAVEKGKGGSKEVKELLAAVDNASSVTFILGPDLIDLTEGTKIMEMIRKLAGLTGARVFAPTPYSNIAGLLSVANTHLCSDIHRLVAEEKIDLLYLVGDAPFKERPNVECIIHQGAYPPSPSLKADLVIPAATWGETGGTYVDPGGDLKIIEKVAQAPEDVLDNIGIFGAITGRMGIGDVGFDSHHIDRLIPDEFVMKMPDQTGKTPKVPKPAVPDNFYPSLLIQERTPHAVHSVSLSRIVAGLGEIVPEETLVMNPVDANRLNLCECAHVEVESAGNSRVFPIKVREMVKPGYVFLLSHSAPGVFETNPCPVHLRRKDV